MSRLLNKIFRKAAQMYALRVERGLFMNWLNPFATIYFNLRLLPLKDAVRLPIFVYGRPRVLSLYGHASVGGGRFGIVKLNRSRHVAGAPANMGGKSEFNIWGLVVFKGTCQIGTGCKICVGENGKLEFGDEAKIMSQCHITAYKSVEIGNNMLMAHASQIFDTSYHYVLDREKNIVKSIASHVKIGDNCWICNSSTIMGQITIPSNTIVASHSLVIKDMNTIPEYSVVAGHPAKMVASGRERVYSPKLETEINSFFSSHPDAEYMIIET